MFFFVSANDLPFAYLQLDPHVKVEGKRVNVLEAKKKILEVLETRVSTMFTQYLIFTICLNNYVNSDIFMLHLLSWKPLLEKWQMTPHYI